MALNPIAFTGTVIHGFGRGAKELGIPTANLDVRGDGCAGLAALPLGIYHGWAAVADGPVFKMVVSIGTNPHFAKKQLEDQAAADGGGAFARRF